MTGSCRDSCRTKREGAAAERTLHRAGGAGKSLPLRAQGLEKLELHGVCRPARSVSGDYYDFLVFTGRRTTGSRAARRPESASPSAISAERESRRRYDGNTALRCARLPLCQREFDLRRIQCRRAYASREEYGRDCDDLFQSPGRILSLLNPASVPQHAARSTQPCSLRTTMPPRQG